MTARDRQYSVKVYAVLVPCEGGDDASLPCARLIDIRLTRSAADEVSKNHPGSFVDKRFASK